MRGWRKAVVNAMLRERHVAKREKEKERERERGKKEGGKEKRESVGKRVHFQDDSNKKISIIATVSSLYTFFVFVFTFVFVFVFVVRGR